MAEDVVHLLPSLECKVIEAFVAKLKQTTALNEKWKVFMGELIFKELKAIVEHQRRVQHNPYSL